MSKTSSPHFQVAQPLIRAYNTAHTRIHNLFMGNHEHAHGNLEAQKDAAWQASSKQMAEIAENGGFAEHVRENRRHAREAFPSKASCVCCMDGRISAGGARAAGSGLLLDQSGRESFIHELKKAGVTVATRHPDCGAEGVYTKRRMAEGVSREEAADEIKGWYAYLAKQLGGKSVETVPVSGEFHNERAIYYDFTGTFNPAAARRVFPPGFVISRKYLGEQNAKKDVELGITIATGDHGFGDRFTSGEPLMLIIVAENKKQLEDGQKELWDLLARREVRIVGFIKP